MSTTMNKSELKCEVCNNEPSVGVASVPGIPYSAAYGRECLQRRADPYWIIRANVACCGGVEHTADWALDTMTFADGQYMTLREALVRHPLTEKELSDDDN